MKKAEKVEKEIKQIEREVDEYIHSISDIKVPTDKEFNKSKAIVDSKVISCTYFAGITNTNETVYDVIFEYVVNDIIYKSKMQTLKKYDEGSNVEIYYYKKDPNYIRELDYEFYDDTKIFRILVSIILILMLIVLFFGVIY